MPKCVCCGNETPLGDAYGSWKRWDFKRRWVCLYCQSNGKYTIDKPDERTVCCIHGLPCISGTMCKKCIEEDR